MNKKTLILLLSMRSMSELTNYNLKNRNVITTKNLK